VLLTKFLSALVDHWFSIVGGVLVSVGLMIWEKSGGPPMPGWLFGSLMGLAVLVAAFFAWREQWQRAEQAEGALRDATDGRPDAVLEVLEDGFHLCLDVRNIGAQGLFRATVETEGSGFLRPLPAVWEQTNSAAPFEIGRGLSGRLRLATLFEDRRHRTDDEGNELPDSYGWSLFYTRPGGQPRWSLSAPLENTTREWFTLRVVVTSNPEMQSGRAIKRLRFVGREVIDLDSAERYRPRHVVYDDEYDDGR
jgi:hypothetical protein